MLAPPPAPASPGEEAIERGKEQIAKLMRKEGLPLQRLMSNQAQSTIAAEFHQSDVSALYAAVGEGRISAASIVRRLVAAAGGVDGAADDAAEAFTPSSSTRTVSPTPGPNSTPAAASAACCG